MTGRIINGELEAFGVKEDEVKQDIRKYERIRTKRDLTEAELEVLAQLFGFLDEMRGYAE